ncbi:MAG: protein phosphatase 2C domain-containing protein [Clostridiales bacterium]|nr:protein phosphatase 2C domain-containing protein [Clostridiales bacterium]
MVRMICGQSVRGASHIRNDKPCQDSFKVREISDTVSLVAVADGHGSESCPFSKTGAKIAVNTFCTVVGQLWENLSDNQEFFMSYLNREGEVRVAQAIDEEWKRRVWKAHLDNKREKPLDAEGKPDKAAVYRMYGTTLLGLLLTPDFLFAFQIGDGDILYLNADQVQPVIEADKILGTETHSLSSENAWKKAITVVRRREEGDFPQLYLMATDGFSNSYPSTEGFEGTCRDYFHMIQEHGFETVAGNLKDWLSETSELGCGDDITVVMSYFC